MNHLDDLAMGKDDNIFSIAGSQKPKRLVKPPPPAAKPIAPLPPGKRPVLPSTAPDPAINEMLKKMQAMHDELESKILMVYNRMGLNKDTLKRTLDNPKNYERLQLTYEKAQEQRRILRDQIMKMFGSETLQAMEEHSKQKALERHKKKSLGARKNWLDMH